MELSDKVKIYEKTLALYRETVENIELMQKVAEAYDKPFNKQEAEEHIERFRQRNEAMRKHIERSLNEITELAYRRDA